MNKKSFAFVSFFLTFFFVFIGSFYGWVATQFNEEKFEEKAIHYFNKNFPDHHLRFEKIDFKLTNKIQYKITDLKVVNKSNDKTLLKVPHLTLDIPVGGFLGGREVRLRTTGLNFFFESKKELQDFFFPPSDNDQTVLIDLPQLINKNKVSFLGSEVRLTLNDTGNSYTFKKIFFKNLNMTHYTAFEMDGDLEKLGHFKSYGEVDLGDFFSTRKVKVEGYITVSDLKGAFENINGTTFKVLTVDHKDGYHFSAKSNSNNISGDFEFWVKKNNLYFNFMNLITPEHVILNPLKLSKWLSCPRAGKVNVEGRLNYNYKTDLLSPDLNIYGDCFSFEAKLGSGDIKSYDWTFKKNDLEGFSAEIKTNEFDFDLKEIEKARFTKNYVDFNKLYSFEKIKNFLESHYSSLEGDFYFPIEIRMNQINHNEKTYKANISGVLGVEKLLIESLEIIDLKNKKNKMISGKLDFSKDGSYSLGVDFDKSPADFFSHFLLKDKMTLEGIITQGSYTDTYDKKVDSDEKNFNFTVNNGRFSWLNIREAVNLHLDKKSDLTTRLLWSEDFKSFVISGRYKKGILAVDYKYRPKDKKILSRSGQINSNFLQKIHNIDFLYANPSKSIRNYLIKNFGSTQLNVKLESDEQFKLVK